MANNMDKMQKDVPGISWTMAPKTLAWQRPPKHAAISDVLQMYVEKTASPETMRKTVAMLKETQMPLSIVAETIMLMGVNNGDHTIDAGILVMPVLMELIKTAAMLEGVDVPMYPNDTINKEKPVEPEIIDNAIKHAFTSMQETSNEETSQSSGLMSKKKEVM